MYFIESIESGEFKSCKVLGVFKNQAVAKTFWPYFENLAGTGKLALREVGLDDFPVFIMKGRYSITDGYVETLHSYAGLMRQVDMLISSRIETFQVSIAIIDDDWALDVEYPPLMSPFSETSLFVNSIIKSGFPTQAQLLIGKCAQRDDIAGLNNLVDHYKNSLDIVPSDLNFLIRSYKSMIEMKLPSIGFRRESHNVDEAMQMILKLESAFHLELPKQRGLFHLRQFEYALCDHQKLEPEELTKAISYFNQLPLGSHKDADSNSSQLDETFNIIKKGFHYDEIAVECWRLMKKACWNQLVKFPCPYYWVKYLECITRPVIGIVNSDNYSVAISSKIREQQSLEFKTLIKASEVYQYSSKEYLKYLSDLRQLAFLLRPYDANYDSRTLNLIKLITERVLDGKLDNLSEDDEYLVAKAYKHLYLETKSKEIGEQAIQLFNNLTEKSSSDSKYTYQGMKFEIINTFIESAASDVAKQAYRDQILSDCMCLIDEPCSHGIIISDLVERLEAHYLAEANNNRDYLTIIEKLLDKHDVVLGDSPQPVAYGARLRLSLFKGNVDDAKKYLLLSLVRYRMCGDNVTRTLIKNYCDNLGNNELLDLYDSASGFIEANIYRSAVRPSESKEVLEAYTNDQLLTLWESTKQKILAQPVSNW